jgi:Bcr/CflA subfamily drug resistance transporter
MVEYTLTIYLFAFAIGTFFWGNLSDRLGRKPCIVLGLIIYIIGCICCYLSFSINILMISRFIQAFGASIGSVLAQAVCRDAFQGSALGKAYSLVSSALAIFPAIAPIIGGITAEKFGWANIFLFLIFFASICIISIVVKLPETHTLKKQKAISIIHVANLLIRDKKVVTLGLLVAACNGIMFSYYAEGSFYLIEKLGLLPSHYGISFIPIACSTMAGGLLSKKLQDCHSTQTILGYGIKITFIGALIFSSIILFSQVFHLSNSILVCSTIVLQMTMMAGICMTNSNSLAMALVDYRWCIGTASSLFGLFYYVSISLFTLVMGALHNGTLLPMPLYFLSLSIFMILIYYFLINEIRYRDVKGI